MIKVDGREIYRGGEKIGWVEDKYIFDRDGKKRGYFGGECVYNLSGTKLACISNDYLYSEIGGVRTRLEEINKEISGGVLEEIARCAVFVLLGG